MNNQQPTPVIWLGSTRKTVQDFPLPVRQAVGFALFQAQLGGKHIHTKPLKGFAGTGVLEIVERYDGDTYRAVYTVKFVNVIYVLHSFQKKSKTGIKTPKPDLDLIKKRLQQAQLDYQQLNS
ncbi:MAG: type II toxin-antitoxin system RelE/ParE family toxin [Pleurocapsa minor HA4230-MV1]|jgi:phage-related protein|nr:type II toxin-antitoxin system RelE/ParE family toxin [Pleurocapsa minor HA4230-MV1]